MPSKTSGTAVHPQNVVCESVPKKMGECFQETGNFSLFPGGSNPRLPSAFVSPLSIWALSEKMNRESVNMEVMDDIFQSFVLQLVVVQILRSP